MFDDSLITSEPLALVLLSHFKTSLFTCFGL